MRVHTAFLAASLCCSAVFAPTAFTQPPAPPSSDVDAPVLEDEIVVTAQLDEAPADTVGASVTVIGREEIERRHETTVLELLRTVPGVAIAQNGGLGTSATVFLRGASSAHTLVLLDGVRLNATGTGAFDFGSLTVENLERIEVLRGPQSTLYGSEALGGVVSLITRRGDGGPRLSAEAAAGSDAYRRLALRAGGGTSPGVGENGGGLDWTVGGSRFETDGVSAASERAGNTEDDGYEDTHLSGRLGWAWGDTAVPGRLDLTVRDLDTRTEIDGFAFGVGPVDDLDYLQDRELTQAALAVELLPARRWSQRFHLGTADETLLGDDPSDPFNEFTIDGTVREIRSLTDLALTDHDTLTAGLSVEEREAGNLGTFDESSTLRSAFVEHRGSRGDRFHWTAGLRHDDDSRSSSETTYRLTAVTRLGDARRTRLHGSLGTAFRTPSFNERFFPGAGNPTLVPETSRGWEVGIEHAWAGDRARVDATWFDQSFDDLIVFDLDTFLFGNVSRAASRGVELTARARVAEPVELAGSYTWNDTEDETTGLPLARRPEHRATAQVTWQAGPRLRGTTALVAVRDRIDSDTRPLDDYERWDMAVEYLLGERWRPYLRLDNLLDEDYEEVRGFTTPGRTALVGLKATF